jgi:hypothetical protein
MLNRLSVSPNKLNNRLRLERMMLKPRQLSRKIRPIRLPLYLNRLPIVGQSR